MAPELPFMLFTVENNGAIWCLMIISLYLPIIAKCLKKKKHGTFIVHTVQPVIIVFVSWLKHNLCAYTHDNNYIIKLNYLNTQYIWHAHTDATTCCDCHLL